MIGILKQEWKTLFKSSASFSILITPIVLMVGLGFLIPSAWIVPSSITIGIVGAVLLYFGGSLEEIKRTSFMKSISLTKLNKFTFLATKVLFSVFISFVSILWVLFFGFIFSEVPGINFLAKDFSNLIPGSADGTGSLDFIRKVKFEINWANINWPLMFYAGSMTIVVSISMAFVFVSFSKSSLSFYLASFGYLLAMILFGGVVMPSFLISDGNSWFKNFYYVIPNYFTNNVMAESFGNGMGPLTKDLANTIESISGPLGSEDIENLLGAKGDVKNILEAFFKGGTLGVEHNGVSPIDFSDMTLEQLKENLESGNGIVWWEKTFTGRKREHSINFDQFILGGKDQNMHLFDSLTNIWNTPIEKAYVESIYNGDKLFMIPKSIHKLSDSSISVIKLWSSTSSAGITFDGENNLLVSYQFLRALSNNNGEIITIIGQAIVQPNFKFQDIQNIMNDGIDPALKMLRDMFDTASADDLYVPWIETTVFLGISTIFFKWS